MRISFSKDHPESQLGETLVHVEVSEIDILPESTYSHSFKYKVPSGTDQKGEPFGEIIVYTDKNAASGGNSFPFTLEKCHNKDCKDKCPANPNLLLVANVFHTKPKGNSLLEFGAALFQALFSGYAGQLLKKTEPLHPNGGIYLQLNSNEDLDAIPWEYANYYSQFPVHQRIFARIFARMHNRPLDRLPKLPLRIVAVVPDPITPPNQPGADLADLHLSEQFRSFINWFTENKKAVKLERVFPPTVRQMRTQLMRERETATVLHFMGHCGQEPGRPRALIFEHNDNGQQEHIEALRLFIPDNLRLAFLSTCDSRDIARVLAQHGVPYTIGSNCLIPDDLAREFEFEFYKFITEGFTVETAMYHARALFQYPDNNRRRDYFAGAMILYSSKFGEDMFKCADGDPEIKLHEPPHNLTDVFTVSNFSRHKKEFSKLYIDLKRMVNRGSGIPHIYTIKGVGGQEFVAEAMRRMAHLFPGGIFAWAFDEEISSANGYFQSLVEVVFSNDHWKQLTEQHGTNIQKLGSAIIKEFRTHATCLLILYHADILDLGEKEHNMHAMELGKWFRRVSSEQMKILVTSSKPLHWCTGEVMDLNSSMNPVVYGGESVYPSVNKETVHKYFARIKEPTYFYGVPTKNLAFVERSDILSTMEAALGKTSVCNILALSGLGGMGKTQLMLRYCYLHRTAYEFVFWLDIDNWDVAVGSFCNLAIKLGMDKESTKGKGADKNIINWICSWLQERTQWLLLLNNCDGNEMEKKVFDLLPRIGGDIILTTRLHISSKKATVIHVGKMQEEEAVFLLLGISSMNSIDKKSDEFSYAREIIAKLDCMPLALALACAYVKSTKTPFQKYLSMLQKGKKRIKLFEYKDGDDDYRHTVATVWQLSFERIRVLNPTALQILEACAFLYPENIPVHLFKQQHSVLQLSSSSSVSEHDIKQSLDIEAAVTVLVNFSFVTRTYNEVKDDKDPADGLLTIHRLVQKVIYDTMDNDYILRWAQSIPTALTREIDFSDPYAPRLRMTMDTYFLHIRHLVTLLSDLGQQLTVSKDLADLLTYTIVYLCYNGMYFGMGESDQLSIRFSEAAYGLEHPKTADSLEILALLYKNQGKYNEVEPLYQRSLAIREKVLGSENSFTATSVNNLAGLYEIQGKYGEAELLYQRSLAIREKVLGSEHLDTAISLNNLAGHYVRQGKYDEAELLFQRSLAIYKKLEPGHPFAAASQNNLAKLYKSQGKYGKAEPLYQESLAIHEKVLGPEHPSTATSLNNLAKLYKSQGKYDEVELLYQRSLAIKEKVLGSEHPSTATSLNSLAGLYKSQGKYDEAYPLYQRSLAIHEKVLGSEHPSTVTSLSNLAGLYKSQGKYDEAEPLYQLSLAVREKLLGSEHPSTVMSLNNLAQLYESQGRYNEAEPLLQRALVISKKVLGADHPSTVILQNSLAVLYVHLGK